jgi:hypothetical protein
MKKSGPQQFLPISFTITLALYYSVDELLNPFGRAAGIAILGKKQFKVKSLSRY